MILKQHRWVLYENKDMPADILRNIGQLAGLAFECVRRGSERVGLPVDEGNPDAATHEDNPWSLAAEHIYLAGRLSQDNLQSLIDMNAEESAVQE